MTLAEFRERLQRIRADPTDRLFSCDGSPFGCRLFILGINNKVNTGQPFWKRYWTDHAGFDNLKLLSDLRRAKGELSRTRQNIEYIRSNIHAATGERTLDANTHLARAYLKDNLS